MARYRALAITISALLVGFAFEAGATPFSFLPNGDLLVETAFKTQGIFKCHDHVPTSLCSGSGTNSVVLGAGPASATITFSGVNTVVQVGASTPTVVIGEFHTFATGGFTFASLPLPTGTEGDLLFFSLVVEQFSPVPSVGGPNWNFTGDGGLRADSNYFNMPLGPLPPGFHYRNSVFVVEPWNFSLPASGDLELSANIGLAPEPGTLVLLGTTAAGLGVARWLKRRRSGGLAA
jgi:hypothetical protein